MSSFGFPSFTFHLFYFHFQIHNFFIFTFQGGIHIYHLLTSYISSWPSLLFSFLTIAATIACHGTSRLIRSLSSIAMH